MKTERLNSKKKLTLLLPNVTLNYGKDCTKKK
jgi:hypothetical protein